VPKALSTNVFIVLTELVYLHKIDKISPSWINGTFVPTASSSWAFH
jgi:hypothetical protein